MKIHPNSYSYYAMPLILLVSDCVSPAWRKRLIHPVLDLWGRNGLITILQLLPERLWERTALASEIPVQLHSSKPGVPNSKLIEKFRDEYSDERSFDEIENAIQEDGKKIQNSISIPVITLEPEPLLTWSRVIVGQGNVGTPGFKLSSVNEVESTQTQQATEQNQIYLTAPELVSRFRATASPMARRLAGLMAGAPISLPVVQLIQQTLLPQSGQIHVAEVFMSGLLKPIPLMDQDPNPDYIEYEFIEGVRELLLDSVPISKTNLVIERVSEFIAQRVGLSLQEFEARLLVYKNDDSLETKIRPFAQLKAQVLRRLGGDYTHFAEQLEAINQKAEVIQSQGLNGEEPDFLPFQVFPSEVATIKFEDEPPINLQSFEFEVATIELEHLSLLRRTELVIKRRRQESLYFPEDLANGVQLEMVQIPGGSFLMGAPANEKDSREDERPQHQVTISPFYIGKYPVTQAQWKAVASLPQVNRKLDTDPSKFKGANRPVERVSWYDAVEFCDRLAAHTNRQYRLPSEAEWEYACRAGTTTPFHFGETMTLELANYNDNYSVSADAKGTYRKKTTEVGSFGVANAFGLYDMHGNVLEWCLDDWHDNYEGAPTDGSPWFKNNSALSQKQGKALLRGGSCIDYPRLCRSASRLSNFWAERGYILNRIGFRVVCGGMAAKVLF
jgi:formylglycine-generating enzyme required for sulfatase activity